MQAMPSPRPMNPSPSFVLPFTITSAASMPSACASFSRIVLDNVPNLQASWVTMGMKVGQVALRFGCNDFGSLMIEENVVSAANTTHRTTIEEMELLIREAGYTPRRRQQDYRLIEEAVA